MPKPNTHEQNPNRPGSFTVALPFAESDTIPIAAASIRTELESIGVQVLFFPTLTIEPLPDHTALDNTLRSLGETQPVPIENQQAGQPLWLLLATPPAVQIVAERLVRHDSPHTGWHDHTIVLGLAAQATLEQLNSVSGLQKDTQPSANSTLQQVEAPIDLARRIPPGSRLLIPVAEQAHEPLLDELTHMGFHPTPIPAYSRFLAAGGDPVPALLFQGEIDAIFLPSPDHLHFFRRRLAREGGGLAMLDHVYVLCAGTWTAQAARAFGLRIDAVLDALDPKSIASAVTQLHPKFT